MIMAVKFSDSKCKDVLLRIIRLPGMYIDLNWAILRRFWFSLLFIAIFWAKILHIYSHLYSIPWRRFAIWCPTFFVQDVVCILIAWVLTLNFSWKWVRGIAALLVIPTSLGISSMSAANTSFFVTTGAEIHWRQANNFYGDVAAYKMLLTGLTGMLVTEILFVTISWCATPYLHNLVGNILRNLYSWVTPLLHIVIAPLFRSLAMHVNRYLPRAKTLPDPEAYEQVPRDDYEDRSDFDPVQFLESAKSAKWDTGVPLRRRLLVVVPIVYFIFLRCIRPADPSYAFLSQTLVLAPFDDPKSRGSHSLLEISGLPGDYSWLGDRTALTTPPRMDWLPRGKFPGFGDWEHRGRNQHHNHPPEEEDKDKNKVKNKDKDKEKEKEHQHYDSTHDPLHISNLKGKVIDPLHDAIHHRNVTIKHVFLFKLESTRPDVFPLRKGSYMHDRIKKTYGRNGIPTNVEQRLAKLTRAAERLTGTPSGFNTVGNSPRPYGGIHATNSYTASTYTLKSMEATLCGISPLAADFNVDYQYHIYQPCMPHILGALSAHYNGTERTDNFTSWPWHSGYLQSVTDTYDNQYPLTRALGFKDIVSKDSIIEDRGKNESNVGEEISNWGYPDDELRVYFRNAIENAKQNRERLFLTYLTGISHHPWHMPHDNVEELVGSLRSTSNEHLNRYLNTIGFVDRWFEELLGILKETSIANETLIVMTGDHGTSLAENGGITPYDNPHVSNFHVPLVFSHPHIPPIQIDAPVTSIQILPTILDLLKETSSLDDYSANAVNDLLPMYEGQSMIRPLIPESDGKQDWQFTVMNTGGSWLSVRSAIRSYRLVIPLVSDFEWRFSDVATDPKELHHLLAFDLWTLFDLVRVRHGDDAVDWINNATHVAQWWVADNWRRFEYT